MATKNVTDENFETEVLKANKPTLVDFWAEWCGPCKQIGPVLEEISNEMSNDIIIAKHNIDENPNQPTKYGVRGIPTMLLFKTSVLKFSSVISFNFPIRYFQFNNFLINVNWPFDTFFLFLQCTN